MDGPFSSSVSLHPETLRGFAIRYKRRRGWRNPIWAGQAVNAPRIQGFGSSGTRGVRSTHLR